jgi:hypothetical protein
MFTCIGVGLLLAILMVSGARAREWHVPGDVGTPHEALELATTGDVISIAAGTYKIHGSGHLLPAGLTIRAAAGMPGAVVFEERPPYEGGWRSEPVFKVNAARHPVTIENITFCKFTATFGPNDYAPKPIFHVTVGTLKLDTCTFDAYIGTALKFDDGVGIINDCVFMNGRGNPAVLDFAGRELTLDNCEFLANAQRIPGDVIRRDTNKQGSLLKLRAGDIFCNCSLFADNGPFNFLVDVGADAYLHACTTCMADNNQSIWQGRVVGTVRLDVCEIVPARWQVLEGGTFLYLGNGGPKAAVVEQRTLSDVKTLFD